MGVRDEPESAGDAMRFGPSLIVACATFMEMLDSTAILTSLPAIADSFAVPAVELNIGLSIYMAALVVFTPLSGWAADRWGGRTLFGLAIALFVVASVLCGISQSLPQFAGARLLQGMAASMMSPIGRLIVLRTTPKEHLVRAINFMTAPGLIGIVLGPAIGGFVVTFADWRWIFFLNIPIGLLGVVLVFRWLPNLPGTVRRPLDVPGFLLNALAMFLLIWGMETIGGGVRWLGAAMLIAGLFVGWLSYRRARRIAHPLVDLAPLAIPTFYVACVSGGSLYRLALAGSAFILPLLFQIGLGLSAFVSGILLLVHSAADLAVKAVTTRIVRGLGFRSLLISSCAVYAVGLVACLFFAASTSLVLIGFVLVVMGLARSLQMTGQTSLQFADVPGDQLAAASTLSAMSQHIVRAAGIAAAAVLANLATWERAGQGAAMTLEDMRWPLAGGIAATIAAAIVYAGLNRHVALHVSGHDPGRSWTPRRVATPAAQKDI